MQTLEVSDIGATQPMYVTAKFKVDEGSVETIRQEKVRVHVINPLFIKEKIFYNIGIVDEAHVAIMLRVVGVGDSCKNGFVQCGLQVPGAFETNGSDKVIIAVDMDKPDPPNLSELLKTRAR